jgi:hypothetical protein
LQPNSGRASCRHSPEGTIVRTYILMLCVVAGIGTAQADPPAAATRAAASDSLPEIHRFAVAATTDADSVRDARSLAPTTAPPWNPPEPMNRRRRWERVVLVPGHILSLPFAGAGRLAQSTMDYVEQQGFAPAGFNPAPHSTHPVVRLRSSDLYGLGAGVEVNRPVFPNHLETTLHGRFGATIYGYNAAELALAGKPLTLQYGYEWRPREHFYGVGPATPQLLSDYALQSEHFGARLDHVRQGPRTPGAPEGTKFSLWAESRTDVTSTGRAPNLPSYVLTYPDVAATSLGQRVNHLVYGGSVSVDERHGVPHWYQGGRLMLSAERHDAPLDALRFRDASMPASRFTRLEGVGEAGFSFFSRDPRTLRVMARVVDEHPDPGSPPLLPSELAMLGDREGLAGFDRGRFHDLDLALTRVSYILPLSRRFELDTHSEWGSVYHDVWTDAQFRNLEHSYGVALRGRYELGLVGAVGADFSREGYRVSYSLGTTR